MRFSILVHGHQPPDNYDWVFHEAIEKAYAPFFALLDEFRWLRVSVHFSGSLLEWIERNNPALIDWIRTLVERGQVELVTAGLYEPVLALIPSHDRANQILAHRAYLRRLFGADTTIAWLTERVWQQPIVEDLVAAGITALPLDDGHFLAAGVSPEELTGSFITEHQGSVLTLVPGLQDIRFAIPFIPVEDAINVVERHADEGVELLTFADDIEKLGLWPGTYDTVHTNGWLRRFLHGLDGLDSVEVPGDQQHERDRAEQNQNRVSNRGIDAEVFECFRRSAPSGPSIRMGCVDDSSECGHGALRLFDADIGFEASHERPVVLPALTKSFCVQPVHGNPKIRRAAQTLESGRHYAHDCIRLRVEGNGATDDGWICAIPALP